jgi:uncharacterized protein (TIGR02246 family)
MWCVADLNDEYLKKMEDVLEVYERPYDPDEPVVCLDEKPVTLHDDVRPARPMAPGKPRRPDNEYKRCGTANVFCAVEPKAGQHFTLVTPNRSAPQLAPALEIIIASYPAADTIHMVMDNLNIHGPRLSWSLAMGAISEYALVTMRTISVLALTGLTVMLGACGSDSPAVNKVAIEKSITDVEKGMRKAANDKDAAAFAAYYITDAVMMTPGMPAMKGQDAVRAGMKDLLADPNFKIDFASDRVEVADSGEMAATRGSFTMTVTNPATKKAMDDKGSYVTVFRKQKDGAWKAVLDIDVSELPPPAPPPLKAVVRAMKGKGKKR